MTAFVFGYGSLVRRPDGLPCNLLGHRRAWNVAMDNRRTIPGYKFYVDPDTGERPPVRVTFLSLYPAPEGRVKGVAFPCRLPPPEGPGNGVAFPVTADDLDALDRRERNYDRIHVTRLIDADL